MKKRQHVNVCGIRVPVMQVKTYGGGHIYPTARDIGTHAKVSRATAQKLANSVGARRLPPPGYETKLCQSTWLVNRAGRFEVDRRASGGLQGRRGRR
jgi:hypothetical protein